MAVKVRKSCSELVADEPDVAVEVNMMGRRVLVAVTRRSRK